MTGVGGAALDAIPRPLPLLRHEGEQLRPAASILIRPVEVDAGAAVQLSPAAAPRSAGPAAGLTPAEPVSRTAERALRISLDPNEQAVPEREHAPGLGTDGPSREQPNVLPKALLAQSSAARGGVVDYPRLSISLLGPSTPVVWPGEHNPLLLSRERRREVART